MLREGAGGGVGEGVEGADDGGKRGDAHEALYVLRESERAVRKAGVRRDDKEAMRSFGLGYLSLHCDVTFELLMPSRDDDIDCGPP